MNYISHKKNELNKLKMSDIDIELPSLKNTNKSQVISEWIINWIDLNGMTDCLLPTKAEFAYALGVSLGTVQNVFKILEDRNYIYLKQRVGAIIKNKNEVLSIRKQTSKIDIVVELIKEYIKNSKIEISSNLPSARQFAKILEVSINSTRLAINKLAVEGIIEINQKGNVLVNKEYELEKKVSSETLVEKVQLELKKYISKNFRVGEKLPSHSELAQKFKVSGKTIYNALKLLEKEDMLLSRRGAYGTIVISNSMNSAFEPKREMSIFASAQQTAFYHYEKTQNKIKKIISESYGIGSKLPTIKEFSAELDLSPNTIRKALSNLAKEGILHFARGRYGGTFVIDNPDIEEQTFRWLAVNPKYAEVLN